MQSLFEQNERKKEDNRQLIDLLATPQVKMPACQIRHSVLLRVEDEIGFCKTLPASLSVSLLSSIANWPLGEDQVTAKVHCVDSNARSRVSTFSMEWAPEFPTEMSIREGQA